MREHAPISAAHQARMDADERVPRFTVIFDREGYSPDLFLELQKERIAALTYHRYPQQDWTLGEFQPQTVHLWNGEAVQMKLAEREVHVGKRPGLQVREIRKLAADGHQVSIVSANRLGDGARRRLPWRRAGRRKTSSSICISTSAWMLLCNMAPKKFLTQRPYSIRLGGNSIARFVCSTPNASVVSSRGSALPYRSRFPHPWCNNMSGNKVNYWRSCNIWISLWGPLTKQRKAIPQPIAVKDLPEAERFTRLRTERKQLLDTIKMIAYRAETAMAATLREKMARLDDARALLRQIYTTEVDLLTHPATNTLNVGLHHMTQAAHDAAVRYLCEELTATETLFPGTDLRLVYTLGSS